MELNYDDGRDFFGNPAYISVDGVKFKKGTVFRITEGGYFNFEFIVARVYPAERFITCYDLGENEKTAEGRTLFCFEWDALKFHLDRDCIQHPDIEQGWV